MGISIKVVDDPDLIIGIITSPALWSTIAEDGERADEFEVDCYRNQFLAVMKDDETCIGLYILHAFNGR